MANGFSIFCINANLWGCIIHAWLLYWFFLLQFGFVMILFMMYCWWRDIIREATLEGQHTTSVQTGLKWV